MVSHFVSLFHVILFASQDASSLPEHGLNFFISFSNFLKILFSSNTSHFDKRRSSAISAIFTCSTLVSVASGVFFGL